MKFSVAALIGSASALGSNGLLLPEDYKFMEFVTKHGRSYGTTAEFDFRFQIFKKNLQAIEEFNRQGNTHSLEINHFADRTDSEMKKFKGLRSQTEAKEYTVLNKTAETSVNWVTKGAVTRIRDQRMCGSCWAFSATGAVEGAMFLATGTLQEFSEQQLVDCATEAYGNYGCDGGLMQNAFKYIAKYPLEGEKDYPYFAIDSNCKFDSTKAKGKLTSYANVTPNSVDQLKAAIAKQPVSVSVDAGNNAFQFYGRGIITAADICTQDLDHGVLAVGYGVDNGVEYFLVKNSWGTSWGESGYVRIGASAKNVCGILSDASYPIE